MFYGFVITERGNNILAHMVAGQKLTLTRVVMDKGTAESAEAARSLTEPIDAGPAGTSTLPVVKDNQVNMIVEYRSDLNGGLEEDFWIGGFAIYAKDPEAEEGPDVLIYYGSLGNARQYVRAYVEGTAADVRRYPVAITVTAGVEAVLNYPAEAWMTADDIGDYVDGTLKPELLKSLTELIQQHNADESAHPGFSEKIQAAADKAAAADRKADSALTAASGAASSAATAAAAASAAQKAAGTAQESAEKALEAVTKLTNTIDAVPSQAGNLIYNGSQQQPQWNNYNPDALDIAGQTEGTDADTYEVTFTPKGDYNWRDGGQDPKTVQWKIERATIQTPPKQDGVLTYTGDTLTPTWTGYDQSAMTLGGTTEGEDAGSYDAEFTPDKNHQWAGGDTGAKTVQWTIGRATISKVPTQSGSLTYTGGTLAPSWDGYDPGVMTKGGTTEGEDAGSYDAEFTPDKNHQWSGGDTRAKTVQWTIGKAEGSLTLDKQTMKLSAAKLSDTIKVTRPGDGVISAKTTAGGVASVSVAGDVVTVTAKGKGNATITVSVAAGKNYKAPADKDCSVEVTMPTSTLEENSWATIKEVSDAGQGENYWSVGDTKRITIDGKVGDFTFSKLAVDAFIIGFNHNSSREGTNRIHFQIGKIGGKDICLCDSHYSSYDSSATTWFKMNATNTNSGGWNGSNMRKAILGNSGTPSAPPANSLLAALPADLRAVMKSVTKYSDNTGGGSDSAGYVTSTVDYLFLLAEFEYHGTRTYANSAEKNFQLQYAYYKASNSKVKYKHAETATAARHWCRSVHASNGYYFCLVNYDGSATNGYAYFSWGVAPGFAA